MADEAPEPTQGDLARKAQALKQTATPEPRPEPEQTANEGMQNIDRAGRPPSGAFDAEGQRPVLERSRKVR
jgi:hypothetical protein